MKIIAHRGASHDAPENTLHALQLAWHEKADGVEVDVRTSKDGRNVLMHDETLARTTGLAGRIADQTWDILRATDAGSWKGPRWRHSNIPLLRDVLRMVPNGRLLYLELKGGREMLPALMADFDVARPPRDRVRFLSFDLRLLREVHMALPTYGCYWNVEPAGHIKAPRVWTAEALGEQARRENLHGLSVGCCAQVDAAFIRAVQAQQLGLAVWTVDDEKVAARLQVDGLPELMTNRPGYMLQHLRRK